MVKKRASGFPPIFMFLIDEYITDSKWVVIIFFFAHFCREYFEGVSSQKEENGSDVSDDKPGREWLHRQGTVVYLRSHLVPSKLQSCHGVFQFSLCAQNFFSRYSLATVQYCKYKVAWVARAYGSGGAPWGPYGASAPPSPGQKHPANI